MKNVTENARDIYDFRDKIIKEIKEEIGDSTKSDEETQDKKLPNWVDVSGKRFNEIKK